MSKKIQQILAIETSCDDTSVALVNHEGYVLAMCQAHQDLKHQPFGGVVPEVASRQHTLNPSSSCMKNVSAKLQSLIKTFKALL